MAQQKSRSFKDIAFSFDRHPKTKDILIKKNEQAIVSAVKHLILTNKGERPFQPRLGSEIKRSLFENFDVTVLDTIKDEIESTIRSYEPRAVLEDVTVAPAEGGDFDSNSLNVTVKYKIIGQDIPPQQLSFALEPTR